MTQPFICMTDLISAQLIKNLDMIKYLNMLKQEHYKDMELQEYLDREDRYSMIFFVDENMALIKSVIRIFAVCILCESA